MQGLRLSTAKHPSLFVPCVSEVLRCITLGGCIHIASFSLQLSNGPNKLECYITLGWKGLKWTNALPNWAHSYVKTKLNVVNTVPGGNIAILFLPVQIS
jgi:hypothetical protein